MCEELGSVVLTSVRTTSCCIKRNIIHWAHTLICGSILSPSSRSVLFMSNLSRPQTGATRRPIGAAERSSEYYTFPFWLSLLRPRWSRSTRLVEALRSMVQEQEGSRAGAYWSREGARYPSGQVHESVHLSNQGGSARKHGRPKIQTSSVQNYIQYDVIA